MANNNNFEAPTQLEAPTQVQAGQPNIDALSLLKEGSRMGIPGRVVPTPGQEKFERPEELQGDGLQESHPIRKGIPVEGAHRPKTGFGESKPGIPADGACDDAMRKPKTTEGRPQGQPGLRQTFKGTLEDVMRQFPDMNGIFNDSTAPQQGH